MSIQARDLNGEFVPNVFTPLGTTQVLAPSGSSVSSNVFNSTKGTVIRLISEVDIHYKVGTSPTATTSDWYLPLDSAEQVYIPAGYKIAVIGTGTVYASPYEP